MAQDPQTKGRSAPSLTRDSGAAITGLKLVTITSSEGSVPGFSVAPTSQPDPYVGKIIDNRYKVEELLGEGGMGVVYLCRHKIIDKKVAMKILRSDMARDKEVTERFLIEAKAASAIGHEHIIDISDFGQLPNGEAYFVMEYLDGNPLSIVIEGGNPVPVPRILHIAKQLANGLAAAHSAGIVHRDLKPDNIYLVQRGGDKDFVKILDFGIAKVQTGAAGKLTRAGSVFGTPHYMSPEQAAGAPVDHRGDIYSFGVILYELACGKVPFDADNFMGILTQHMYKAPVPIRALVPPPQDIPPGLEAVILKCLSKRPEQRYETMAELFADLEKVGEGLVPDAVGEMMARSGGFNVPADFFKRQGKMPEPVPATPAGARKNRWPLFAGLAGVAAAVGLVVAIFAKSAYSPASPAHKPGIAPVATAEPVVTAAEPEVSLKQVVIATEPLDAEVVRDGKSLGTSPVLLDLAEGQRVELEVRRAGYVSQKIHVDPSEPRKTIRLQSIHKAPQPVVRRAPAGRPAPKQSPQAKPKQAIGGGEIVNPWGQ